MRSQFDGFDLGGAYRGGRGPGPREDGELIRCLTQWSNFGIQVKTGNPNGGKLPKWHAVKPGGPASYVRIDVETKPETEAHRGRYTVLDKLTGR